MWASILAKLTSLVKGPFLYLAGILGILAAIWGYGKQKKREGVIEHEAEELKEINEAVRDQREVERAIRSNPDRERVREHRDELKRLLRLGRATRIRRSND
jgi:hypothetical protein